MSELRLDQRGVRRDYAMGFDARALARGYNAWARLYDVYDVAPIAPGVPA